MSWLRDAFIILGIAAVAMVVAMFVSDEPKAGAWAAGAVGVAGAMYFAFKGFMDDMRHRSGSTDRPN